MSKFNNLFVACVSHRTTLSGMAFARYNHYYFCHSETHGSIYSHNLVGAYIHLVYRFGIKGFKVCDIHKDNKGKWEINFSRSSTLCKAGAFFNEEAYEGFLGTNHTWDLMKDVMHDGPRLAPRDYMNHCWTN